MRFKREHQYTLEKYEERLYKEVIYDARPGLELDEVKVLANPLKKAKAPSRIRNMEEAARAGLKAAHWPIHPQRPHRVQNMHEPSNSKVVDPYHWMGPQMSKEDRDLFLREETEYYQLSLLKQDMLYRQILREQEHYRHVPRVLPVRIGDFVYYRKFDNPADSMTLYRLPLDEQKARGLSEGEMPRLTLSDEQPAEENFPEEVVFSISDLKQYYADFAQRDPRIKEFVERVTDFVVTQEYQPLHSFQISEEQKFAVLSFDTEEVFGQAEGRQAFDLLVKDLSIDRLMPVLILNTDGQVAFDRFQGFFYTQVGLGGRGHKVFRHQLGTLHQEDVLIYEEKNPDFSVSGKETLR